MLRACLVFFSKTVQFYLILFWSYGIESRNFYYNFKKNLISLKYWLKIQFQVPLLFPKCLIFTFHVCPPLTWAYTDLLRQHLCPAEADFKRTPGQMDQAASSKVSRDEVHRPPPRCCCYSSKPSLLLWCSCYPLTFYNRTKEQYTLQCSIFCHNRSVWKWPLKQSANPPVFLPYIWPFNDNTGVSAGTPRNSGF